MDKWLRGLQMYDFEEGDKLPAIDKHIVLNRFKGRETASGKKCGNTLV